MILKPHATVLTIALLFSSACSQQGPDGAPSTAPKPADATSNAAAKPAAQMPKPITPDRIAEIKASGQTGMWSSVTEVCVADIKSGIRTVLTWNVTDSGSERVVVYVVDPKNMEERHFGQGQPVDERETGPWLKPGMTFKIRDFDSKEELGAVVIGEKSC